MSKKWLKSLPQRKDYAAMKKLGVPHVLFTHQDDSWDCPCKPTFHVLCEQCDGDEDGCWNCNCGLKEVSREEAEIASEVDDETVIIVHRDVDIKGREKK